LTLHSTGSSYLASYNKIRSFPKCQIYNMVNEGKICAYFSATVKMETQQNKGNVNVKENWFQILRALLVVTPILSVTFW